MATSSGPWKKYETPPDMLTKEANTKSLKLSNEQMMELMNEYIEAEIASASTDEERQSWTDVKVRKRFQNMTKRLEEAFVEDFMFWLTGRSQYNVEKRTVHKAEPYLDAGGAIMVEVVTSDIEYTPWGNKDLTHVPGVQEFIVGPIDNRDKVIKTLTKLKLTGPRTLDEAWLYYKYIVRKVGINQNSVLEQQFYNVFDYPEDPPFVLRPGGPGEPDFVTVPDPTFSVLTPSNPAPPRFDEELYSTIKTECMVLAFRGDIALFESKKFGSLSPEDKIFVLAIYKYRRWGILRRAEFARAAAAAMHDFYAHGWRGGGRGGGGAGGGGIGGIPRGGGGPRFGGGGRGGGGGGLPPGGGPGAGGGGGGIMAAPRGGGGGILAGGPGAGPVAGMGLPPAVAGGGGVGDGPGVYRVARGRRAVPGEGEIVYGPAPAVHVPGPGAAGAGVRGPIPGVPPVARDGWLARALRRFPGMGIARAVATYRARYGRDPPMDGVEPVVVEPRVGAPEGVPIAVPAPFIPEDEVLAEGGVMDEEGDVFHDPEDDILDGRVFDEDEELEELYDDIEFEDFIDEDYGDDAAWVAKDFATLLKHIFHDDQGLIHSMGVLNGKVMAGQSKIQKDMNRFIKLHEDIYGPGKMLVDAPLEPLKNEDKAKLISSLVNIRSSLYDTLVEVYVDTKKLPFKTKVGKGFEYYGDIGAPGYQANNLFEMVNSIFRDVKPTHYDNTEEPYVITLSREESETNKNDYVNNVGRYEKKNGNGTFAPIKEIIETYSQVLYDMPVNGLHYTDEQSKYRKRLRVIRNKLRSDYNVVLVDTGQFNYDEGYQSPDTDEEPAFKFSFEEAFKNAYPKKKPEEDDDYSVDDSDFSPEISESDDSEDKEPEKKPQVEEEEEDDEIREGDTIIEDALPGDDNTPINQVKRKLKVVGAAIGNKVKEVFSPQKKQEPIKDILTQFEQWEAEYVKSKKTKAYREASHKGKKKSLTGVPDAIMPYTPPVLLGINGIQEYITDWVKGQLKNKMTLTPGKSYNKAKSILGDVSREASSFTIINLSSMVLDKDPSYEKYQEFLRGQHLDKESSELSQDELDERFEKIYKENGGSEEIHNTFVRTTSEYLHDSTQFLNTNVGSLLFSIPDGPIDNNSEAMVAMYNKSLSDISTLLTQEPGVGFTRSMGHRVETQKIHLRENIKGLLNLGTILLANTIDRIPGGIDASFNDKMENMKLQKFMSQKRCLNALTHLSVLSDLDPRDFASADGDQDREPRESDNPYKQFDKTNPVYNAVDNCYYAISSLWLRLLNEGIGTDLDKYKKEVRKSLRLLEDEMALFKRNNEESEFMYHTYNQFLDKTWKLYEDVNMQEGKIFFSHPAELNDVKSDMASHYIHAVYEHSHKNLQSMIRRKYRNENKEDEYVKATLLDKAKIETLYLDDLIPKIINNEESKKHNTQIIDEIKELLDKRKDQYTREESNRKKGARGGKINRMINQLKHKIKDEKMRHYQEYRSKWKDKNVEDQRKKKGDKNNPVNENRRREQQEPPKTIPVQQYQPARRGGPSLLDDFADPNPYTPEVKTPDNNTPQPRKEQTQVINLAKPANEGSVQVKNKMFQSPQIPQYNQPTVVDLTKDVNKSIKRIDKLQKTKEALGVLQTITKSISGDRSVPKDYLDNHIKTITQNKNLMEQEDYALIMDTITGLKEENDILLSGVKDNFIGQNIKLVQLVGQELSEYAQLVGKYQLERILDKDLSNERLPENHPQAMLQKEMHDDIEREYSNQTDRSRILMGMYQLQGRIQLVESEEERERIYGDISVLTTELYRLKREENNYPTQMNPASQEGSEKVLKYYENEVQTMMKAYDSYALKKQNELMEAEMKELAKGNVNITPEISKIREDIARENADYEERKELVKMSIISDNQQLTETKSIRDKLIKSIDTYKKENEGKKKPIVIQEAIQQKLQYLNGLNKKIIQLEYKIKRNYHSYMDYSKSADILQKNQIDDKRIHSAWVNTTNKTLRLIDTFSNKINMYHKNNKKDGSPRVTEVKNKTIKFMMDTVKNLQYEIHRRFNDMDMSYKPTVKALDSKVQELEKLFRDTNEKLPQEEQQPPPPQVVTPEITQKPIINNKRKELPKESDIIPEKEIEQQQPQLKKQTQTIHKQPQEILVDIPHEYIPPNNISKYPEFQEKGILKKRNREEVLFKEQHGKEKTHKEKSYYTIHDVNINRANHALTDVRLPLYEDLRDIQTFAQFNMGTPKSFKEFNEAMNRLIERSQGNKAIADAMYSMMTQYLNKKNKNLRSIAYAMHKDENIMSSAKYNQMRGLFKMANKIEALSYTKVNPLTLKREEDVDYKAYAEAYSDGLLTHYGEIRSDNEGKWSMRNYTPIYDEKTKMINSLFPGKISNKEYQIKFKELINNHLMGAAQMNCSSQILGFLNNNAEGNDVLPFFFIASNDADGDSLVDPKDMFNYKAKYENNAINERLDKVFSLNCLQLSVSSILPNIINGTERKYYGKIITCFTSVFNTYVGHAEIPFPAFGMGYGKILGCYMPSIQSIKKINYLSNSLQVPNKYKTDLNVNNNQSNYILPSNYETAPGVNERGYMEFRPPTKEDISNTATYLKYWSETQIMPTADKYFAKLSGIIPDNPEGELKKLSDALIEAKNTIGFIRMINNEILDLTINDYNATIPLLAKLAERNNRYEGKQPSMSRERELALLPTIGGMFTVLMGSVLHNTDKLSGMVMRIYSAGARDILQQEKEIDPTKLPFDKLNEYLANKNKQLSSEELEEIREVNKINKNIGKRKRREEVTPLEAPEKKRHRRKAVTRYDDPSKKTRPIHVIPVSLGSLHSDPLPEPVVNKQKEPPKEAVVEEPVIEKEPIVEEPLVPPKEKEVVIEEELLPKEKEPVVEEELPVPPKEKEPIIEELPPKEKEPVVEEEEEVIPPKEDDKISDNDESTVDELEEETDNEEEKPEDNLGF